MFKKVMSLLIVLTIVMMMSCLCAAAAEDNTDETTPVTVGAELSEEDQVAQDAIKALIYEDKKDDIESVDDIELTSFEKLDDGIYLFQYELSGVEYSEVGEIETIGKYQVTHCPEVPYYIYNGEEIIELKDAYEQGIVTDEMMDALVESNPLFSLAEEEEPDEDDGEDIATPDEATPDEEGKTDGTQGPSVQTGAVFSGIVFLLMAECIIVAIVYRRKLNNIK